MAEKKNGEIVSVNVSEKKGTSKKNVGQAYLREDYGLEGDAHASHGHRQVSLLAEESIDKIRSQGLAVGPGDFAENLTTGGIDLLSLTPGTRLQVGSEVILEITQIGKICPSPCAIYYQIGDCLMPREGIFARVITGGWVRVKDSIRILSP